VPSFEISTELVLNCTAKMLTALEEANACFVLNWRRCEASFSWRQEYCAMLCICST
jgi:hypothetical protein